VKTFPNGHGTRLGYSGIGAGLAIEAQMSSLHWRPMAGLASDEGPEWA
jgi:hypothetical protein